MIEKLIREYLKTHLNMPVYMEEPENIPDEYIIVEKVGSSMKNYIKSATIAVQTYASSFSRVIDLNEQTKDTMLNIIELSDISRCSLNSDYNFTDIETKRYRYQAIFDITYY